VNTKKRFSFTWGLIVIALLGLIGFNIPMPYYLLQPGTADNIRPMVTIEGAANVEKGSFLLTTVLMGKANLLTYGYANVFDERVDLIPSDLILHQGESPEQYNERQSLVMEKSQNEAILVAFQAAGIPIEVKHQGVTVMTVLEGMPAAGVLQFGDVIHSINGKRIQLAEELIQTVEEKKAGDKLILGIERDDKQQTVEIVLAPFKREGAADPDAPKVGIGIALEDFLAIKPSRKVTINAEDIGGPSAGLMFSLEIFNQLTETDWTKGYQIAGTGTINSQAQVGQIGGIEHKIYTADQEGVDIFFAPKDIYESDTNEKKAKKAAARINTKMRIISVATFQEALDFLNKLEVKEANSQQIKFEWAVGGIPSFVRQLHPDHRRVNKLPQLGYPMKASDPVLASLW
jgi:PDZ domain-containing protein